MNPLALILIVLVLLVFVNPNWGHAASWGYYPSGGLGLVLLVLLILILLGRL